MINDQLLRYIKQQLSLNVGRDVISANLKSQGWTDADLSEAFGALTPVANPAAPVVSTPPVVSSVIPTTVQMQPSMQQQTVQTQTQTQTQPQAQVHPQTEFPRTAQPQIQSVHSMGAEPAVHKHNKIIPIVLILILFASAIGAAGYAYYTGVFVSLPDLVSQSVENAEVVQTAEYDIAFDIDFSGIKDVDSPLNGLSSIGINSKQIDFSMKGAFDKADLDNLKFSSNTSFTVGGYVSVEAELRIIGNTLYAKLAKMPTLGTFPLPIPSFSEYENKWFSLSLDPWKDAEDIGAISFQELFTEAEKSQIREITKNATLIKTVKRLSPETVGGEFSYHFSFDLDHEGIISYLQSLVTYLGTTTAFKDSPEISDFDQTSIRTALDSIKDFKGEIWIGRNDKLVHKMVVDFGIQPDISKNEQIKMHMSLMYDNYNKPVYIITPSESTPFESLMQTSLGEIEQKNNEAVMKPEKIDSKANEAKIKATLSTMRAEAEIFYDGNNYSYTGFCASSKLKNARKTIEGNGGTGFVCNDTEIEYALGANFSASNGWCVDSMGYSVALKSPLSGTLCPKK